MVKVTSKKIQPKAKKENREKIKREGITDSAENLFKVPKKQWAKWRYLGRKVFNEMYQLMGYNCDLFLHPKVSMKVFCPDTWNTTAWNAARMAAEAADRIADEAITKFFKGKDVGNSKGKDVGNSKGKDVGNSKK